MSTHPLVSIVCAVYNGEATIRQAIESVLIQNYTNWELILVNDGSKDATVKIIEEYIAKDARIKIYTNTKNLGQTASLNEGVKYSKGEYIGRIDADDQFLPGKLQKQIDYILQHPDVAVCGTNAICHDTDINNESEIKFPETHEQICIRMLSYSAIIHVSVLMNKSMLAEVGEYDTTYNVAADYDLWVRFIKKGMKMYNVQEPLVKFNYTVQSFGRNNSERTSREFNHVNASYLMWVINEASAAYGKGFTQIQLPQDFFTFSQVTQLYAGMLTYYFEKGDIRSFAKMVYNFYKTVYVRSRVEKYQTTGITGAILVKGLLYLSLLAYPLFVIARSGRKA